MAYEMRQQLKMTQTLVMTPQLQQAIKLLQLSRLELTETVQQELLENPFLEEATEDAPNEQGDLPDDRSEHEPERDMSDLGGNEDAGESIPDDNLPDLPIESELKESLNGDNAEIDWMSYLESRSVSEYHGGFDQEDREEYTTVMTETETLTGHLEWQLQMANDEDEIKELAMVLIGNLNDDGSLTVDLDQLAEEQGVDPEMMLEALLLIQEFDPVGVGARNLSECLLLQIKADLPDNPLVRPLVERHLENLANKNYKTVCQDLKCNMESIGKALQIIGSMEPKPGRPYSGQVAQYITPDIYVRRVGDEFVIELNDDGLPKLRVSSYYKKILFNRNVKNKAEKEYIQEKMRSAVWLIRSIHQRQRTIYRVTESLIKFQREFFEKGINHLRPLILRDIAEDIGMHESTISRVTTNKYVHTPQGIFELKFFFNSGLQSSSGTMVASESVKSKIQDIVDHENPKKPCSDQEIVRILDSRHGIRIARRTVTKYREMMGVLSSTKRKKVF